MKTTSARQSDGGERGLARSGAGAIHPLWWLTAAAVALRLLLFLGRGDHVGYDEGFYLLLGRNFWAGDGYTLTGLRHVALSPLFPILAGGADLLLGDVVWAGRVVAAVAAGLLVVPCWSIFRRLAGARTAFLACGLVAVLPSLAPFVAPEWVGWDLWAGAEPLLHLFLFTGIALALRGLERGRALDWAGAGVSLALAYLARPEAVVFGGLLGLVAVAAALARRNWRRLFGPALLGLAFALVASPYWLYLHDAMGRWALTGRAVSVTSTRPVGDKATGAIEGMLWGGDVVAYVRGLYALDPSGTRLASRYWGIPRDSGENDAGALAASPLAASATTARDAAPAAAAPDPAGALPAKSAPAGAADDGVDDTRTPEPARDDVASAAEAGDAAAGDAAHGAARDAAPDAVRDTPGAVAAGDAAGDADPVRGRIRSYFRALRIIVPVALWPLAALGLMIPAGRRWREELFFAVPLVGGGVMIAGMVAIDPRTQLSLAPVLVFYAALGIRCLGSAAARWLGPRWTQATRAPAVLAVAVVGALLAQDARRLYGSTMQGSDFRALGAENRQAAAGLRRVVPEGASLMSWHPGIALQADRDWRVLPHASLVEIVRYAAASGCRYVVFSVFYPSPIPMERMPREYLLLRIAPEVAATSRWTIRVRAVEPEFGLAIAELVAS